MTNSIIMLLVIVAVYVFKNIFEFLDRKIDEFIGFARRKKDVLYERRCNHLYKNIYNHYYTLATVTPEIIANNIANAQIKKLKRTNKINVMYSNLRNKRCSNF